MRVLTRGTAIIFGTMASLGANAADLSYPPPVVGPPQYRMAAPAGRCTTSGHHRSRPNGLPRVSRRTCSAAGWGLPVWRSSANPSHGRYCATHKLPASLALRCARLCLAAGLHTARTVLGPIRRARPALP
jgi:hypothetical protein